MVRPEKNTIWMNWSPLDAHDGIPIWKGTPRQVCGWPWTGGCHCILQRCVLAPLDINWRSHEDMDPNICTFRSRGNAYIPKPKAYSPCDTRWIHLLCKWLQQDSVGAQHRNRCACQEGRRCILDDIRFLQPGPGLAQIQRQFSYYMLELLMLTSYLGAKRPGFISKLEKPGWLLWRWGPVCADWSCHWPLWG